MVLCRLNTSDRQGLDFVIWLERSTPKSHAGMLRVRLIAKCPDTSCFKESTESEWHYIEVERGERVAKAASKSRTRVTGCFCGELVVCLRAHVNFSRSCQKLKADRFDLSNCSGCSAANRIFHVLTDHSILCMCECAANSS